MTTVTSSSTLQAELAAVGRLERIRERVEASGRKDQPVAPVVDQVLHPRVLADERWHARGQCLGGGIGEPVLVGGVNADARSGQVRERIAGSGGDAWILRARSFDEPPHP